MRAFELTIHSVDGERRGASGGGGVGWRRESVVERRRQEGWGESGVVRRGRDVRGRGRGRGRGGSVPRGGDVRGEESGPGELLRVRGRDVREKSIADGSGGRGVGEGAGDGGEDDMLRGAAVALFDLNSSSISCSSCCDKSKTGKKLQPVNNWLSVSDSVFTLYRRQILRCEEVVSSFAKSDRTDFTVLFYNSQKSM